MSLVTCLIEPANEVSDIHHYQDIESYTYLRVLKGSFMCPDYVSEIRLKCIRFSILYSEQWQDEVKNQVDPGIADPTVGFYAGNRHLNAQTVEKLPYMVHIYVKDMPHMRTVDSKTMTPAWIATARMSNDQEAELPNFNTTLDTKFHYSTHAELHSFFNFAPVKQTHFKVWEQVHSTQMGWYYNMQRNVPIGRKELQYEDPVEFEIIMTNVRGKRIIGHYLPPVEIEFELV